MKNFKKVLFLDTETSGLFEKKHDIHQLACLIEIDGKLVDEKVFYCQPTNWENVDKKALQICNVTMEQIMDYPPPYETYLQVTQLFDKYIDKYNPADKFTAAGQNVRFDMKFMKEWFVKAGQDQWFYSYVDSKTELDTLSLVKWVQYLDKMPILKDNKLSTICEYLKIPLDAHDALNDIKAGREVHYRLLDLLHTEDI